jgi:hypothetical protein
MGGEWSGNFLRGRNQTTRGGKGAEVTRIAGRQKQLVTTAQMAEIGFASGSATKRVQAGRMFLVFPGVLALHPPPYSPSERYLAAVLATDPDSLLGGWASAHLVGLTEDAPSVIEVVNSTGRGRGIAGITVHRSTVHRADRATARGIPCTTSARTIVDLARTTAEDELEDLLLAADSKRSLDRRRFEALLDERRGQPGTGVLRRLITDDPVVMRSKNERRMFSICREFGVPLPLTDVKIETEGRTFYADFLWPDLGLVVEAQSWRWHGGRSDQAADADKGQLLTAAGFSVVPFTRDQIKKQRAETGRRLLALTLPRP